MKSGEIYKAGLRFAGQEVKSVFIVGEYRDSVICAPIVSGANDVEYPTHVLLRIAPFKNSTILLERTMILKKNRISHKICEVDKDLKNEIKKAFMISMYGKENCQ